MEDLLKAIKIFLKYDNSYAPTGCEHDVLYVYVHPDSVSSEDLLELDNLGFLSDTELGCFYSYRFGSA